MRKYKKILFLLKIFLKLTPLKLCCKVMFNTLKNFTGFLTPASCVFGVTYRCQLKCLHCSSGSYDINKNELTTSEIKNVLSEINEIGVPRLNLSGGEALIRDDILEIIEFASKYFIVILESNGVSETENIIRKLKKSKISCLSVSIDSPDREIHNHLRSEGVFEKAMNTLLAARKYKIPTIISTYITKKDLNQEYFKKFKKIRDNTGALAIRIMPLRPVGSAIYNFDESLLLSKNDEEWIINNLDPSVFYFKGIPGPSICGIFLKNTFYISPYGEVQPCAYLPITFGSIKEEKLDIILKRMWEHKIFKECATRECLIIDKNFRNKYFNNNDIKYPVEIK
ncbi:MAG: radical SAM protein [Elusimicrobiales bacterium]|nr:radical SAM protein [Elusimicrobiales bacterium]